MGFAILANNKTCAELNMMRRTTAWHACEASPSKFILVSRRLRKQSLDINHKLRGDGAGCASPKIQIYVHYRVCLFHKSTRTNAMAALVSAHRLIATRYFVNYYGVMDHNNMSLVVSVESTITAR